MPTNGNAVSRMPVRLSGRNSQTSTPTVIATKPVA
jgi:hypothetical protein